jgi:hypothetical protein
VQAGRLRFGLLGGLAATAFAAPAAFAQTAPAPTPTPAIAPPPRVQALPGVIPERFSIAPAPSPTPTPLATPAPIATPRAAPVPRAAAPRPAPVARPQPDAALPTPRPSSAPSSATPAPAVPPVGTVPAATPSPVAAAQDDTPTPWLWALGGAGGTALIGLAGWLLLRRRRVGEDSPDPDVEPVTSPEPVPTPSPSPAPPRPEVRPPAPAGEPFEFVLNPQRIQFAEHEILLEFELLIGNASGLPAENIRAALAAMSANPRQDEVIAAFHAAPQGEPAGPPFDLPVGGGGRMPARLSLPREGVHVVQHGGRPMFVPLVLIDFRWRSGLSIRRFAADFMLGTAGQGAKLGPVWLDRPAPTGGLAATRYHAKR